MPFVRPQGGGKYGRYRTQKNGFKTGRNGKEAVCHLFQSGKGIGERWK
jgi:hypothetical protein